MSIFNIHESDIDPFRSSALVHDILSRPDTFGEFENLPKLVRSRITVHVAIKCRFKRGVRIFASSFNTPRRCTTTFSHTKFLDLPL